MALDTGDQGKKEETVWDTIKVVLQALILALVLRTILAQPFSIPSGSMMGTLLIGDYLFVSKYSYGYSRYSIPLAPIPFEGRFFASKPERGDIAVFRLPSNPSIDYIKRIIGLPGDKIQVVQGLLHINRKPVQREKVEDFIDRDDRDIERKITRYRETLPNGKSFLTLDLIAGSHADNTPVFTVPEGHYFMMGDNRDNSQDSRFSNVGFIPFENFIGRAEFLFFSLGEGTSAWEIWKWPQNIRFNRLFRGLRADR